MNKSRVEERIEEIAEKIVEKLALELVHVELISSGKVQTIRVFIDKEEGITHDDCAEVSQQIEKTLEAEDPIKSSYILEVSSPGIERGLYKLKDFERFTGENATVKTERAINGQRNFKGKILSVEDETILFNDKTNGDVQIPYNSVAKAKLKVNFDKELKQAKRKTK